MILCFEYWDGIMDMGVSLGELTGLIEQTNLTMNLLLPSCLNPKMATEVILNGLYDFNRTPIASLGTKFLVHKKTLVRGAWAPRGIDGWYIGPAQDHYRCYSVYISRIIGTRHSETVDFFPSMSPERLSIYQ